MSAETRLGLGLLAAALALGGLGDLLLRATPLGLNVVLWIVALVVAFAVLARTATRPAPLWLAVPLGAFAACVAWRDSPWLAWLDAGGAFAVVVVATLRTPRIRLWMTPIAEYARAALVAVGAGSVEIIVTVTDRIGWSELARGPHRQRVAEVARGVAIAAPLLAIFGALFVAADAVFEDLLGGLAPDLHGVPKHLFVFAGCAWAAAAVLGALVFERTAADRPPATDSRRLGPTETTIVLATLDALFLAFVLVQFRYFFGGRELVEERTGLTYAEYARHGFFELVAVAALAVGVILLADHLGRRETKRHERLFRALGIALVVLLFVIVASALQRMRLYQREFGLTELRVYTTAFMIWIAVVLVWLLATVMRGRRAPFAFGALLAGLGAIFVLNAVNPDALIARTNIERAEEAKDVDVHYLETLSADAAPTLARKLPGLVRRNPAAIADYAGVADELLAEGRESDWRTWNWSRSRARGAVAARRRELEQIARANS